MKRQTHNRISKQLLPWLDPKVIDKVNKAIDKPDPVAKLLSAITGQTAKDNPLLNLGIKKTGHRSANHDLVSAIVKGYEVAGYVCRRYFTRSSAFKSCSRKLIYFTNRRLIVSTPRRKPNRRPYANPIISSFLLFLVSL